MALLDFLPDWGKFTILYIPYLIMVMFMAPSVKWKILFALAGVGGIYLAIIGKSMKGITPLGRKF